MLPKPAALLEQADDFDFYVINIEGLGDVIVCALSDSVEAAVVVYKGCE